MTSPHSARSIPPFSAFNRSHTAQHACLLGAGIALLLASSLLAMEPPTAGQIQQYKADGTFDQRLARAYQLGNHEASPALVAHTRQKLQQAAMNAGISPPGPVDQSVFAPPPYWDGGLPSRGTPKVAVLLVDFPDAPHDDNADTPQDVQNKFFGTGDPTQAPYESLQAYYKRASYDQLTIQGNVLGWYRAQNNRHYYEDLGWGDGEETLIKEALDYFDANNGGHDFAQYDNDNDGTIDALYLKWTGPDTGWGSFWWAYRANWQYNLNYRIDGKKLKYYVWSWIKNAQQGEPVFQAHTDIHETGHLLGLPDLYDYDTTVGPDGGVGGLDMMDANWGDFNCFYKFMLDWLTPTYVITGIQTVALNPSGTSKDCVLVMPSTMYTSGNLFDEFFMAQYRKRGTGNDPNSASGGYPAYPADGLLIWHVDSTLAPGGQNFLFNNSDAAHKLVRLMEADGLEEIEVLNMTTNFVADAGDFYLPGKTFEDTTTPNSKTYAGAKSDVRVDQLTAPGATMSARFAVTLPGITSVTATNNNGTYKVGDTINIQILFTVPVIVTGSPRLTLNTTPTHRQATYVAGSGTTTLLFAYQVQAGDASSDLDYASPTALSLNGGTITSGGTNSILILPDPGSDGSLGFNKDIVIDAAPPSVASISAPVPDNTLNGPVNFAVNFNEPVTGFDSANDILVNATGTAAVGSVSVSGSGAGPYTVTLSNLTGDGTLAIVVKAGACVDGVGYSNLASSPSQACEVGYTPPTVTSLSAPVPTITRSGPVSFVVYFRETVTGFNSASDIQVNSTGTAAAGQVSIMGTGKGPYTVSLSNITGDGTLGITIKAGACADSVGNANLASDPSSTFTVDNTGPTVVSISSPSTPVSNKGPVSYTVNFSEPVVGFNTRSDIQVDTTGTAMAGSVMIVGSGAGPYTVTLGALGGNGSLGITVKTAACTDEAGNDSVASAASPMFAVDNILPVVTSLSSPSPESTRTGPITYTVSFSEAVTGLDVSDIQMNPVGTTTAGSVSVSGSGSGPYTVTLSDITGNGSLGISIKADAAIDAAGNGNPASSGSGAFTVDTAGPVVTWISQPMQGSAAGGPVTYTVTFDGLVNGFDPEGIQLNKTGTASAGSVAVSRTDGGTYLVTLNNLSGQGTLGITVRAGACTDVAGNDNTASSPSSTFDVEKSQGSPVALCGTGTATLLPLTMLALALMRRVPAERRARR